MIFPAAMEHFMVENMIATFAPYESRIYLARLRK
jgi:hypothetical protein